MHSLTPFPYTTLFRSEFKANGVYPVLARIRKMEISEGRWLDETDELEHARVAVLGSEVKHRLFSGRPAVGESIRIGGMSFEDRKSTRLNSSHLGSSYA